MSHRINQQYIHFIWATKNRSSMITEYLSSELLAYISGILRNLGGNALSGSATANHVHLLAYTPTDHSIADLMCNIKSSSTRWYREKEGKKSSFAWDDGYSAFTVSPSSIENVAHYLTAEKHRHTDCTYEGELEKFLNIQEIEFNPKYLTNTTHTKLIYHLVWSVKNREPFLATSLQKLLHQRIQEEVHKNCGKVHAIGNVADHIHLLLDCPSKISTATLVQNLKTTTTYLIRSQEKNIRNSAGKRVMVYFSVGKPALKAVSNYVNNQESPSQD